ncbi:MAG TPA: hypothetical protein VF800_12335 [Telluria sp.]|jgi:hypothetical protein
MIEFTADQEDRAMRMDCRVWTALMVEAWYANDYPHAINYPAGDLVWDLQEVYFACRNGCVHNVAHISLLALLVLRAKGLNCSECDVQAIMDYFLIYARASNVNYARAWIELYLEEATGHVG